MLVFPSCSDDDEDVVTVDDAAGLGSLDEETTSLLRDNILAREQGTEDVAPIALLLARGVSSVTATSTSNGRTASSNRTAQEDLPDCFVETFVEDTITGSFEWSMDFGDGCDAFGEVLKGMIIEKGSYNGDSFSGGTEYINFGSSKFTLTGTYDYEGTFEESDDGSEWTANVTFTAAETLLDTDEREDDTLQITREFSAEGAEIRTEASHTMVRATDRLRTLTDGVLEATFEGEVLEPILTDFSCTHTLEEFTIFSQLSGIQKTTQQVFDASGDSIHTIITEVDFGEGECDFLESIKVTSILEGIQTDSTYIVDIRDGFIGG